MEEEEGELFNSLRSMREMCSKGLIALPPRTWKASCWRFFIIVPSMKRVICLMCFGVLTFRTEYVFFYFFYFKKMATWRFPLFCRRKIRFLKWCTAFSCRASEKSGITHLKRHLVDKHRIDIDNQVRLFLYVWFRFKCYDMMWCDAMRCDVM